MCAVKYVYVAGSPLGSVVGTILISVFAMHILVQARVCSNQKRKPSIEFVVCYVAVCGVVMMLLLGDNRS